jgi:16S rRNA (cytosine1402-N4)-methyltransferase
VPVCQCKHTASFRLINKKVITPSETELDENPRSRSARMRVAERIGSSEAPVKAVSSKLSFKELRRGFSLN